MLSYRVSLGLINSRYSKSKRRWRLTQHKHNYFLYPFVEVEITRLHKSAYIAFLLLSISMCVHDSISWPFGNLIVF